MRIAESHMFGIGLLTSGKVGACARDMVSECRHCGEVVCRVGLHVYLFWVSK